jgi:hypothetical protein
MVAVHEQTLRSMQVWNPASLDDACRDGNIEDALQSQHHTKRLLAER